MKLVHENSGERVNIGDTIISFRGEAFIVTGWYVPRNPNSSGRVFVKLPGTEDIAEYFPGVFNLKWAEEK